MAITKKSGRQEVIASTPVTISYDTIGNDTTSAVAFLDVPANAIVVGGYIVVDTAFNSTTSDVLDVGDGVDDDRYTPTQINLQTVGATALSVTGYKYTAADTLDIKWTAGATGTATQGSARIWVEYIVYGRAAFSQG